MRKGITIEVSTADRARLEVGRRGSEQPAKARLAGADRPVRSLTEDGSSLEIMRRTGKSKGSASGVRLLAVHDCRGGRAVARQDPTSAHSAPWFGNRRTLSIVLTQREPPGEATHWTAAAMGAKAAGISVSSVQAQLASGRAP